MTGEISTNSPGDTITRDAKVAQWLDLIDAIADRVSERGRAPGLLSVPGVQLEAHANRLRDATGGLRELFTSEPDGRSERARKSRDKSVATGFRFIPISDAHLFQVNGGLGAGIASSEAFILDSYVRDALRDMMTGSDGTVHIEVRHDDLYVLQFLMEMANALRTADGVE